MTTGPEANEAKLTGNVLFYRQPEPLSLERHRNLGAKRIQRPFDFLSGAHIVPITLNEFGVAASSYPIIFAGEAKTPLAVMGARGGENVFVNGLGEVDPEIYLPAFVRRYPFVFAAEPSGERLLVCIDRAAPMIGENPEIPLFNGDQPSQYTQEAIEFCKEFERHRRLTEELIGLLKQNDLFEPKTVSLTNRNPDGSEGQTVKVAEYFAVSEERLNNLPVERFQTLREKGLLGPIYAHLISLLLWPKIMQRTIRLAEAKAQAQLKATTPLA